MAKMLSLIEVALVCEIVFLGCLGALANNSIASHDHRSTVSPTLLINSSATTEISRLIASSSTSSSRKQTTNRNSNGNGSRSRNNLRQEDIDSKTTATKDIRLISKTAKTPANSSKSDSPLLNYIFDSHVVTRTHSHNSRFGPHFEKAESFHGEELVSTQEGASAYLNCHVSQIQDKTVSWKRRNVGLSLRLLTVGYHTYCSDDRFSVDFQPPNNWRLRITNSSLSDEGIYECQISSHPPQVRKFRLFVHSPEIVIVDELGTPLLEKFYDVGSLLELSCLVRHVGVTHNMVLWHHGGVVLNYDTNRGGISVRTDLTELGANSTLSIAKLRIVDNGNYTCSIGDTQFFTTTVHVLNESLAELHHGQGAKINSHMICTTLMLLLTAFLLNSSTYHSPTPALFPP